MSNVSIISDTSILPARGGADEAHRTDRWISALAYAISAAALSFALVLPQPLAVFAVAAAFVLCLVGLVTPPLKPLERFGDTPVAFALAIALVAQVGSLLLGITTPATAFPLAAGLLLAGSNLSPARWLGRLQLPLLIAVYVVFAALDLAQATRVSDPLQAGATALLSGQNPYAHGYREMPVLLLLALPARLVGDLRWGLMVATALAAALVGGARPGRAGAIAAGLLLFLPAGLVAVRDAGVEPFITLLAALVVFCACRSPALSPWALGLLLCAKPYLVVVLPLAVVLASMKFSVKALLRMAWKTLLVAAVITAPFVAWDTGAFASAVLTQPVLSGMHAPTVTGWLQAHGVPVPGWAGIPVALVAVTVVLWMAPRTASGFAAGLALTCLGLFAFSPDAVAAQYAFVLAALYLGIGATGLPGRMREAVGMRSYYLRR